MGAFARHVLGLLCLLPMLGCTPPSQRKPIEWEPIGTVPADKLKPPDDPIDTGKDSASKDSDTPSSSTRESDSGNTRIESANDCKGDRFDDLPGSLGNGACEVDPRAERPSDLRDLEVKLTPSTPTITPGGKVDLQVVYRNKGSKPLPLFFALDPSARFDVEATDPKGRVSGGGSKSGKKGAKSSVKSARIIIGAGGSAKAKLSWVAPQTKGRYGLRVVTSLQLANEGRERELAAPRVQVQVAD